MPVPQLVADEVLRLPYGLLSHGPLLLSQLAQAAADDRLPLHLPSCAGGYERIIGAPFHTWPELFIQLSGQGRFTCARSSVLLQPGEAVLIPPGTPHNERLTRGPGQHRPGRQLVFMCQEQQLSVIIAEGDREGRPQGLRHHACDEGKDSSSSAALLTACQGLDPDLETALRQRIHSGLLARVLLHASERLTNATETQSRDAGEAWVRRCKWLVRNGLSDHSLSVASIAQRLGVTADYCSHRFASLSGGTLSQYIAHTRCRHAANLLLHSDLKVAAIAWSCGFADAGYFSRVFAQYYGLRPRAFRTQQRS